jgi:putative methylase
VNCITLRQIKTVVMNPPFGAQKASAGDRAFLQKAVQIADVVYTIHNLGSEGFIRRIVEPCSVDEIYRIKYPLKRCFEFHSRDVKIIEVDLYRIVCH